MTGDADVVDVVIAGFGPVGQTAANILGGLGLRTIVLEREQETYPLPRAAATDDEVLRIWQALGLAGEIVPTLLTEQRAQFVSRKGKVLPLVHETMYRYGFSPLVFFYQPQVEAILQAGAARFPGVEVRWKQHVESFEQDADGVTVWARDRSTGRSQAVRARYLLGCDGGRSTVRIQMGVGFQGFSAPEPWLVMDGRVEDPTRLVPFFQYRGDPRRPAVTYPLPGGRYRWEFMLLPGESAEEMLRPENLRGMLSRWTDPDRVELERSVVFSFHARAADRWREGRVFLLGDAAHISPIFIGQGMSEGIRDSGNLCWKVAAVLRGQAHDRLLDSYERERRTHVAKSTRLAVLAGSLIMSRRPGAAAARDAILETVSRAPGLGKWLRDGGPMPEPVYESEAFMERSGPLFPQPRVRTSVDDQRLLDDVLGPGWAVVGMEVDPRAAMSASARSLWDGLSARWLKVVAPRDGGGASPSGAVEQVEDVSGELATWFGRGSPIAVVRPDRYVFARVDPADADAAARGYRELIGP